MTRELDFDDGFQSATEPDLDGLILEAQTHIKSLIWRTASDGSFTNTDTEIIADFGSTPAKSAQIFYGSGAELELDYGGTERLIITPGGNGVIVPMNILANAALNVKTSDTGVTESNAELQINFFG